MGTFFTKLWAQNFWPPPPLFPGAPPLPSRPGPKCYSLWGPPRGASRFNPAWVPKIRAFFSWGATRVPFGGISRHTPGRMAPQAQPILGTTVTGKNKHRGLRVTDGPPGSPKKNGPKPFPRDKLYLGKPFPEIPLFQICEPVDPPLFREI